MALRNDETISALGQRLYALMDEKGLTSPKDLAKKLYELGLVHVNTRENFNSPERDRDIQYCEVASRWGKANGYKEWRYLFIPSKQVMPNSSFMQLAGRFKEV